MSWQRLKTPKGLPKAKRHKPKFTFSMLKQNQLVDEARSSGLTIEYVIGVDEVGWGCVAGPLVLGCVVLKANHMLGVKDSKAYTTEKAREKAAQKVIIESEEYFLQTYSARKLDDIGPVVARDSGFSYLIGLAKAKYPNSLAIIDGNYIPRDIKEEVIALPQADSIIQAVAAASVVAKVSRDRYMRELDYPYDFHKNKGYPTHRHLELLKTLGPCVEHRRYTRTVKDVLCNKSKRG